MGCSNSESVDNILKIYHNDLDKVKEEIDESREKNPNNCIAIIFKLMNGKSFSILCLKNTKLFNVFLLLVEKAKDSNYSSLAKLKIYYNSVDITKNFKKDSDKDVSSLNLSVCPILFINN